MIDTLNTSICQLLFHERRLAYILTDKQLRLQTFFDPLQLLSSKQALSTDDIAKLSIYDVLPLLIGYEEQLEAIIQGEQSRLEFACIQQQELNQPNQYLRLVTLPHIQSGLIKGVVQFIENIQQEGEMQQMLRQQRNELSLNHDFLLKSNANLVHHNTQLARAVKTREEFLAMISHELRTPLTSVIGMIEVLQQELCGPINAEQSEILDIINDNSNHLLELINDVLDFAKMEAGSLSINLQPIQVTNMTQTLMRMIEPFAREKNIRYELSLDPSVQMVLGDERRIRQILVNLLSNAIKFTPKNGTIGLAIIGDIENKQVHLTVWDTGIGISKNDLGHLFQPYVQLTANKMTQHVGTGLGLLLVRHLTELHKGHISVNSQIDVGSRFTVSLPWQYNLSNMVSRAEINTTQLDSISTSSFRARVGHPDRLLSSSMEVEDIPPQPPTSAIMPGSISDLVLLRSAPSNQHPVLSQPSTILIVDDNNDIRKMLGMLLAKNHHKLIFAHDGPSALRHASATRPDLILLDIMLPGMDGFQVCHLIRADLTLGEVPIVIITSAGDREARLKGFQAGADDFITKPFDIVELEARIQTITQLNRYRRLLFERSRSEAQLQLFHAELMSAYDETIEGWAHALELRDHETEGHCRRVTALALKLATALNYPEEGLIHLQRGALLHDIGKIGVPDSILHKPGPLNAQERAELEMHPFYAYKLLYPIQYLQPALDIPHYHHERWDGNGYPAKLKGIQIPLAARIFAVVDVYDALRSDRPYRKGWSEDEVLAYLESQAGQHFDAEVVARFLKLSRDGELPLFNLGEQRQLG